MPSITYPKGSRGRQISSHFHSKEFDCPCVDCTLTLVDPELIVRLEALRTLLGSQLTIHSGYRCLNYQQELRVRGYETSKGISQHSWGKAADLGNGVALGLELEDAAIKAGFKAIGRGSNWIHVDLRADRERRWSYTKR